MGEYFLVPPGLVCDFEQIESVSQPVPGAMLPRATGGYDDWRVWNISLEDRLGETGGAGAEAWQAMISDHGNYLSAMQTTTTMRQVALESILSCPCSFRESQVRMHVPCLPRTLIVCPLMTEQVLEELCLAHSGTGCQQLVSVLGVVGKRRSEGGGAAPDKAAVRAFENWLHGIMAMEEHREAERERRERERRAEREDIDRNDAVDGSDAACPGDENACMQDSFWYHLLSDAAGLELMAPLNEEGGFAEEWDEPKDALSMQGDGYRGEGFPLPLSQIRARAPGPPDPPLLHPRPKTSSRQQGKSGQEECRQEASSRGGDNHREDGSGGLVDVCCVDTKTKSEASLGRTRQEGGDTGQRLGRDSEDVAGVDQDALGIVVDGGVEDENEDDARVWMDSF